MNENGPDVSSFDETQPVFDRFLYGYHYDGRKRLTEKKIPGKGLEFMVYNKLDQLVYSQDANQRSNHQWSWTKYDALGRVILTGLEQNNTMGRQTVQNDYIDAMTGPLWEERTDGRADGYTVRTHPMAGEENGNITYLTVNYYDDYGFPGNSFGPPTGNQASGGRTKSLLTGTRVRTLVPHRCC